MPKTLDAKPRTRKTSGGRSKIQYEVDDFYDGPGVLTPEEIAALILELPEEEQLEAALAFHELYSPTLSTRYKEPKDLPTFYEFVRAAWPIVEPGMEFIDNKHIEHICLHLEAVTDGRIKRLLINIPPGHAKSLLVSVLWPAWSWLKKPEWRVLCGSYGMDLALRDAMKCRQLLESDWYRETFAPDWLLCSDQNLKSYYRNTRSGERVAVSVGGRVTGFRGNGVVIDDPLNAMDAYSDTKRMGANRWLDEAASNRLNDPRAGFIVIIMQRLHADDMSGHVLEQGNYEHLCLPSRFEKSRAYSTSIGLTDWREEEGELLFPELFTAEVMDAEETRMGPLAFAGQHQQRPTPAAGNMFKPEMFCENVDDDGKSYKFWPKDKLFTQKVVEAYLSFDTATKGKTKNDYTAGCLTALANDGYVYALPLVIKRMEIPEATLTVAKEWVRWRLRLGEALKGARIEEGAGTAVVQYLRQLRLRQVRALQSDKELEVEDGWTPEEWAAFLKCDPIVPLPYSTRTELVGRTMEIVPFCSGRNVRMLESGLSLNWLRGLMGFPLAVHDDETQAFYEGVKPFITLLDGTKAIEDDEWDACAEHSDAEHDEAEHGDEAESEYSDDMPTDGDPDDLLGDL